MWKKVVRKMLKDPILPNFVFTRFLIIIVKIECFYEQKNIFLQRPSLTAKKWENYALTNENSLVGLAFFENHTVWRESQTLNIFRFNLRLSHVFPLATSRVADCNTCVTHIIIESKWKKGRKKERKKERKKLFKEHDNKRKKYKY